MRSTISSLLVLLITLAGCAGSRESAGVPEPFEADDLRRHLSRFVVPAADSARVARRAEYASERFRAARLVPPVGSSFLLGPRYLNEDGGEELDPTRADALAYLPGRNPRYAPRLVLVSAPLGSPGAAAVVAAARALAD
ncbi:MAG: hypothetical protein R3362_06390, partial [Rhodothermales bacterium]|nr:hypothetical protein [Rhodothermales bacterium]